MLRPSVLVQDALVSEELSLYQEAFPHLCNAVLGDKHGQINMLIFGPRKQGRVPWWASLANQVEEVHVSESFCWGGVAGMGRDSDLHVKLRVIKKKKKSKAWITALHVLMGPSTVLLCYFWGLCLNCRRTVFQIFLALFQYWTFHETPGYLCYD